MVLSMTGFGSASTQSEGISYRVEIRSVNNRYFKASIKTPEVFQRFEADIERQLRDGLGRGSVSCALRVKDDPTLSTYEVNEGAMRQYLARLQQIASGMEGVRIDLAHLLDVPGVCEPPDVDETILQARFKVAKQLIDEAISRVKEMRQIEGAAIQNDLDIQCRGIRSLLKEIAARCPTIVQEYHKRLRSRVEQLLSGGTIELDQDILAREVAVFAERCDVNEEIARLSSHLDQFSKFCTGAEDAGRKLDFLAQELLREANTIGSKANDAQVARQIVEIKAAIDRIKEQVQNVA